MPVMNSSLSAHFKIPRVGHKNVFYPITGRSALFEELYLMEEHPLNPKGEHGEASWLSMKSFLRIEGGKSKLDWLSVRNDLAKKV